MPGVLQSTGSHRGGHDLETEQQALSTEPDTSKVLAIIIHYFMNLIVVIYCWKDEMDFQLY